MGYVTSDNIRQMFPIRALNCFALPELEIMSPSRAYRPPMKAPMLVPICRHEHHMYTLLPNDMPPTWSTGMPYSSRARRTPCWGSQNTVESNEYRPTYQMRDTSCTTSAENDTY